MSEYREQKIWPLAKIVRRIIKENPLASKEDDYFRALLIKEIPELENKERCINCEASMREHVFKMDVLNALLLKLMGDEVKRRTNAGENFTEANKIRVSNMENWPHSARCRTNKIKLLGLIAKADKKAHWSVTRRGFAALRGEEIPAEVVAWRNRIEERSGKTTTLEEVFKKHRAYCSKRKKESPHRRNMEGYDRNEWIHFGEIKQGTLI